MYLLVFLIWIFFGTTTAYFAKKRGRSPQIWFCIGLLFGIVGVCALFLLPAKRNLLKETAAIPVVPEICSEHKDKFWYYLDTDQKQNGPMSFDALQRAWKEQKISTKTFVWNETMQEWKELIHFLREDTPPVC